MDIGCGMGFFSIGMARLVGSNGEVIAVDLQEQMLTVLRKRAARKGVADRIRTHLCEATRLGVREQVSFVLAFWMVHEAPDPGGLFSEVRSCLEPSGKMLIAEPRMHVSERGVAALVEAAEKAGLRCIARPKVRLSRAVLFEPV